MKINEEKKAAIKLINQHAEQYLQKEAENKILLVEIEDLKKNIKINKEIIEGFFNPNQKHKSKLFLDKTKEEIALLNQSNKHLRQEMKTLKDKNAYYEILLSESILKYNNSTDVLQTKIFTLDNLVKKKEAIICYLNLKLSSVYDSKYTGEICDREYYVMEPHTSIVILNHELEKEKEYNAALLERNRFLEDELIQMNKEKLMGKENIDEEGYTSYDESNSNSRSTVVRNNRRNRPTDFNELNTSKLISRIVDENKPNWEKDEWIQILHSVKLTPDALNNMGKNEAYKSITEIIEVLIKTIMERNMQLRVLLKSNNDFNIKNNTVTEEMNTLKQDYIKLKGELKELKRLRSCNVSMIQQDKKAFEVSLIEEQKTQYKHYEQYLEDFNAKSMRINDSIADEEIKECCKSFMTHESTINKKGEIPDHKNKPEKIISETVEEYIEFDNHNQNK